MSEASRWPVQVLLRRLRAELVDAQFGLCTPAPPLTLVTQFEDVLTHRLCMPNSNPNPNPNPNSASPC